MSAQETDSVPVEGTVEPAADTQGALERVPVAVGDTKMDVDVV
jgi:hypothetical protein